MKKLLFVLLFSVMSVLLPTVASAQQVSPGYAWFRNTALSSTAVAIKTSSSNLYGYTLVNPNTVAVYVKFYNATVAGTTVGTTAPQAIIMVPPGDGTNPGVVYLSPDISSSFQFFQVAATVACVTGRADNSTAAPSTGIYIEVLYK